MPLLIFAGLCPCKSLLISASLCRCFTGRCFAMPLRFVALPGLAMPLLDYSLLRYAVALLSFAPQCFAFSYFAIPSPLPALLRNSDPFLRGIISWHFPCLSRLFNSASYMSLLFHCFSWLCITIANRRFAYLCRCGSVLLIAVPLLIKRCLALPFLRVADRRNAVSLLVKALLCPRYADYAALSRGYSGRCNALALRNGITELAQVQDRGGFLALALVHRQQPGQIAV